MRRRVYRGILLGLIFFNLILLFVGGYRYMKACVPDEIRILLGEEEQFDLSVPLQASLSEEAVGVLVVNEQPLSRQEIAIDLSTPFSISAKELGTYQVDVSLFGWLPIKRVSLQVIEEMEVVPGGNVIGLQIETDGILVLGTGTVTGKDGNYYEPSEGRLKSGDYILAADGKLVHGKEALMNAIGGRELELTIRRGGKQMKVKIQPVKDSAGDYKIGAWIRTDTQGIGTLTYTTENGTFGALGHGITDIDTGLLIQVAGGTIYEAEILSVVKGKEGIPGELVGMIRRSAGTQLGTIMQNTGKGIFGQTQKALQPREKRAIPVGLKQEVSTGGASILCQIGSEVKEYDIRILKVNLGSTDDNKGLVLQITDAALLEKTGGIVQGMSGSPILQNGKLIGAVTHVFVNDPTKGYGIFIENMLEH